LFLSNPTRPAREERRAFGGHPPQILLEFGEGWGGADDFSGYDRVVDFAVDISITKTLF